MSTNDGVYRISVEGRTVSRGARIPLAQQLAEVWEFRHLTRHLIVRDLKVKYQRSSLGFLWTLLNPLIMVAVLVGVFSVVIRIDLEHYWAFLLSGFFVWNAINQAINGSASLLQENARLTRSIAYPKEVLILASACSRFLEFAVEILIIILALTIFHHQAVPLAFAALPLILLIQLVLIVGLMFPVATLSTLFTDVMHALPVIMTAAFYATPVFYPASLVPEKFKLLYFMNPFASLLTLYHSVLYDGTFPSWKLVLGSSLGAVLALGIGYGIFRRYQDICNELV